MSYKVDTELAIKEVMEKRKCTYEETIDFLIRVIKKKV